jgi:hypothetical protein
MRDIQLFLTLLAERVLDATLITGERISTPTDFKQWLLEAADKAASVSTLKEFFQRL